MRFQGQTLSTHVTNAQEKWGEPSGVRVDRKEKSDSCHIPSNNEVRYARGEVKIQEPNAAMRKTELCVSSNKANSFIYNSYTRYTMVEKSPGNVSKE